ncbi:MAG: WD40 repeat domain-containing serine/threonine-protein kinase [Isosphaeraceae bacterium]
MSGERDKTGDDDDDPRFEAIVAAYLESLDRGHPVNRQQLLAAHPDLADRLAEFLDGQAELRALAGVLRWETSLDSEDHETGAAAAAPTSGSSRVIGNYEILEQIGLGGMGVVYRARQLGLERIVALKMLRDDGPGSETDLKRFRAEARAIGGLDHPNIVPVYEIGEHGFHRYFSMKLIEGGSLADRLSDFAAEPRAAARTVAAIARAIDHAHQRGILHRDLKPSNVLIDERGEPMVADFGLALRESSETVFTRSGVLPGTPAYMSPEQVRGPREGVTRATDIHGLGAVLYALLTGRAPFGGSTPWDILDRVRTTAPIRPRQLRRSIDRDLETICLKCLEKEPARRYATAAELADDLDRWLDGRPIRARRLGPIGRTWRTARRHPAIAGILIMLGLLGYWESKALYRQARAVQEKTLRDEQARRQTQADADDWSARELAEAWQMWAEGNLDPARLIVERHRQRPGAADNRGFGWRLVDRVIHVGNEVARGHHWGAIYSASFSPDGKTLVAAGMDRIVGICSWDRPGDQHWTGDAGYHANEVNSATFSPDGRLVASASDDQTVQIADVRSGRILKKLTGLGDEVVAAVFTPDGRRLISACRMGDVSIWDTGDWHKVHSFLAPNANKLQGLAVSPDGSLLAVAGAGGVVLYDLAARKLERLPRSVKQVNCVAFSRDGNLLGGAGPDDSAWLWQKGDWSHPREWSFQKDPPESIAFHPDGKRVAIVGGRGIVHLLDFTSGSRDQIITGHGRTWCATFSPDGRSLVTTGNDGLVKYWNADRDGTHLTVTVPAATLSSLAFSPDGNEVATVGDQGQVFIHDARTGKLKRSIPSDEEGPSQSLSLSSDARFLIGENASHRVVVRSLLNGSLQSLPIPPGRWHAAALGMRWVITGTAEKSFRIDQNGRSAAGSQQVESVLDGKVSFSTSGDTALLSGTDSDKFWLCDLPSARLRSPSRPIEMGGIQCHALSADGKRLATGGKYGRIVLWNATTLEPIREHFYHPDAILSLAISPDGRTLAAGDADRTVTLWDVPTGRVLTSFRFHAGPVRWVRFSPDGNTLASASPRSDGSSEVFFWLATSSD